MVDGETMAYFYLYFANPKDEKFEAKYYFEISFDEPIKIADSCKKKN